MNTRLILFALLFNLMSTFAYSQVGIGTISPNSSAIVDVYATDKALLLPRLTAEQRAGISSPANGLVIFCTNCGTNGEMQIYTTNAWKNVLGNNTTTSFATLSTTAASSISYNTATAGGNITFSETSVSARGVCWSTSQNPTISNSKTTDGTSTGSFNSSITGLTENTTYYLRAYATNTAGTIYGSQVSFTTVAAIPASLATTTSSAITGYSATISSNITSSNGAPVTERGVCYSTSTGPTTSSSKLTNGIGTGTYDISITGLLASTTYYVRSYAINSAGTAYGTEISFTTGARSLPSITTTSISAITATTASSGGNVTSSGNDLLTERGICWNTSINPTTANSKLVNGTATTGTFTSGLTGLTANTTYYVRAYATNSVGTEYGNELSFTTSATLAGSLSFNGSNQYLSLNPGIIFGSGAFTLEGWFYHTSNFVNKGLIGTTNPSGNNGCLNLYFSSATSIISDKHAGGGTRTYTMASAITANAWHYFIYNRNSDGTTAIYIDGTRCTATISDNLDYTGVSNFIGQNWNTAYWSGYLTNFRVNVGTAVYNSNVSSYTNPTSELSSTSGTTKYLMLGNSATSDASNTQTITNNGTVGLSALKPF
jgi:hypothetical protein